jgi:hypothetical protein
MLNLWLKAGCQCKAVRPAKVRNTVGPSAARGAGGQEAVDRSQAAAPVEGSPGPGPIMPGPAHERQAGTAPLGGRVSELCCWVLTHVYTFCVFPRQLQVFASKQSQSASPRPGTPCCMPQGVHLAHDPEGQQSSQT